MLPLLQDYAKKVQEMRNLQNEYINTRSAITLTNVRAAESSVDRDTQRILYYAETSRERTWKRIGQDPPPVDGVPVIIRIGKYVDITVRQDGRWKIPDIGYLTDSEIENGYWAEIPAMDANE